MERSLLKRRKIALLFIMGVGIPSLLLGYLALRGIRNEIALSEQRRTGEHRELSQVVGELLEEKISGLEEAAQTVLFDLDQDSPGLTMRGVEDLEAEFPLVEAVFHFGESGAIQFVSSGPLFHSDGSYPSPEAKPWPPSALGHIQTARRQEFQEGSFRASEASYRRALSSTTDSVLQGEALLAITRVQRKAGELQAALATCSTLTGRYSHVRTTQGLPLGPVAQLERASLLLALGDTATATTTYRQLYESLLEGAWVLERGQFDFLVSQAWDALTIQLLGVPEGMAGEEGQTSSASIEAREAQLREKTERLLLFQEAATRDIRMRMETGPGGRAAAETRVTLEDQRHTYLVLLLSQPRDETHGWGVLLDSPILLEFLGRTLNDRLDPATSGWILRGRNGQTVLAAPDPVSGSTTLNATFSNNFPPWLIEFYQRPESPYKLLFASSQSVYVYMFLLIASILAFGLVLTVRAMSRELELARLKSDFVSTVSHEFKSPLTSIRHMAEMLQAGSVPTEDRRQRYYDVLVEQTNRLSGLVTNILDLARIEEGRQDFRFEPTDIGPIVRELVETAQHRVGHDGFTVEASIQDPLPAVRVDSSAISQAISNLLENAIQYSGEAKRVIVRAFDGEGGLTIEVEDGGVGIPPHELEKIFDRFYRGGDPLTRAVKGSGLGLSLVKEIVEGHGGQIRVSSTQGQGSTFSIDLPVLPEHGNGQDPDY